MKSTFLITLVLAAALHLFSQPASAQSQAQLSSASQEVGGKVEPTVATVARGIIDANGRVVLNGKTQADKLAVITAKTATGTLAAKDLYGTLFTNTGAAGAIVLTLPAPVVGMKIRVFLTVAQDVDINPADGTQILALTNATGDAISSAAAIGNYIELTALSTTTWGSTGISGTWTDVN